MATISIPALEGEGHWESKPVQYYTVTGTVQYSTVTHSDNSVTYTLGTVTVNWSCTHWNGGYEDVCTACCGQWGLRWWNGTNFKTWNWGVGSHFPEGTATYTTDRNLSFTLAPGASKSVDIYSMFTAAGCTGTSRSVTFKNNLSKPQPTSPSFNISCAASQTVASTASFSTSGSFGYCDHQSNSASYTLSRGDITVQTGSGTSATFFGLAPNTAYLVTATWGNGCYNTSKACTFATLTPNTLTEALASSWQSGCARVVIENGNGQYKPTTTIRIRKCNTSAWTNVGTTNTTTVETVCFDGLEENTCYEVQACTQTDAGTYCGNIVQMTTPKKCVQAQFLTWDSTLNEETGECTGSVEVKWQAFTSPAQIYAEYRVKNGYDTNWLKSDVLEITDPVPNNGSLSGTYTFTLPEMFPNLVTYELRIAGVAEQEGCELYTDPIEMTTPLMPEADPVKICNALTYLNELICQSAKAIYTGNKTIHANPATAEICDPYSENPTHLTLWSRVLRFFQAMNCVVCEMRDGGLKSAKPNQYYAAEIGWVDMLAEVVPTSDSESWRLVMSKAVQAYIDSKLHEVWHYQGTVDIILDSVDQADASEIESFICLNDDKVYAKSGNSFVVAADSLQPEDFAVYHIRKASTTRELGQIKAESGWYYFGGVWQNLDGESGELEGRIEEVASLQDELVLNLPEETKSIKVVDVDYDFETGPSNTIYFVTGEVSGDTPYYTVTAYTNNNEKFYETTVLENRYAYIPDYSQKGYTFVGWVDGSYPNLSSYMANIPTKNNELLTTYENTMATLRTEFDYIKENYDNWSFGVKLGRLDTMIANLSALRVTMAGGYIGYEPWVAVDNFYQEYVDFTHEQYVYTTDLNPANPFTNVVATLTAKVEYFKDNYGVTNDLDTTYKAQQYVNTTQQEMQNVLYRMWSANMPEAMNSVYSLNSLWQTSDYSHGIWVGDLWAPSSTSVPFRDDIFDPNQPVTKDLTLAPIMAPKYVTVTFNLNGAPGTPPAPMTRQAGSSFWQSETPQWEGHVFKYWVTADGLNADTYYEDTTLYAVWYTIPENVTVTFDPGNGDPLWTVVVPGGSPVPQPPNPTFNEDPYCKFQYWEQDYNY